MAFVPEGRQRQQNPHCSVQDPAGHTCECLKDPRGMHTEQTVSLDKIRFPPAPPPYRCFATAEARIYTKSPKICKSPENKREFWMPVIFLSTGSIHPSATRISLRLEKCTFLVGGITSQVARGGQYIQEQKTGVHIISGFEKHRCYSSTGSPCSN